jgi:uncharacterized protein (TIGR02246 family)
MTRMPEKRITLALTLAALALCVPAVTLSQQSEEAAIRAIGQDWQRAIAARDVDRIVSFFAPDVVLMNPNSPVATGTAAARTAWTGLLGMPGVSLNWTPTRIEVTSPTTATEIGTYNMSFGGPTGQVNDRGSYVTLWRKIDGQWRVASDATVSSVPMAATDPMASMDITPMEVRPSGSLAWTDLVVKGFPPGAKRAVLHGNPAGTGDYVLRLQFPDGYEVPVHWHPKAEHVTVLSGNFHIAMGGTRDPNLLRSYSPGDFVYMPARSPHFATARGVTTVQLHGIGPFQLNLGTP